MCLFGRIVREPMVHFLVVGAAIFVLYARVGGDAAAPSLRDRIVVTEGRIQQLGQIFHKTWQRPPTTQELRGLIDAYVKEEVYYREALKLGLDRDDTLIRRRMQQKMEFLTEPSDDVLTATDAELQSYLTTNRAEFRVEAKVAFQQIYVNPERSEEPVAARAEKLLSKVVDSSSGIDPDKLGDPTLLPAATPLVPVSLVDRNFGQGFGQQLTRFPVNIWSGPLTSPYGLHLVRITERRDGYDPPLAAVRKAVEFKWRTAKREAFQQAKYQSMREKYEVVLPEARSNETAKLTK